MKKSVTFIVLAFIKISHSMSFRLFRVKNILISAKNRILWSQEHQNSVAFQSVGRLFAKIPINVSFMCLHNYLITKKTISRNNQFGKTSRVISSANFLLSINCWSLWQNSAEVNLY